LYASVLGAGGETYAEAHQQTIETGKPMVVMVSTDWCMPCQEMKKTVLPKVREDGLLSEVSFAVVNPDKDRALAQQLTGGGPVPQLLMYRNTTQGWKRRKLIGGQTVAAVRNFIREGLSLDRLAKRHSGEAPAVATVSKSTSDSQQAQ
jgi:thioredoxin-like negative regulator of GroEL